MMTELALRGGTPVRSTPYPKWPQFDAREIQAVSAVIESGVWGAHRKAPGPEAVKFIEGFAPYQGAQYGVLLANGTMTIKVAFEALDVGWGDEVIVPAMTFSATYYGCILAGALPIIVDITPTDLAISSEEIEAAITPNTRAIIPVHLGHQVADMDRIMEIAHKHSLFVVEDAAHAHGQRWRDRGAGCIGDFGSFSHQSSKTLTAGEGGSLLTNDERLARAALSLIDCGRPKDSEMKEFSYGANHRLGELHAALLTAQLERFEEQRSVRADAMAYFEQLTSEIQGIRLFKSDERITRRGGYQYIFAFEPDEIGEVDNEVICEALNAEGVPCSTGFPSAAEDELFDTSLSKLPVAVEHASKLDRAGMSFPVADRLAHELIWLPHEIFLAGRSGVHDIVEAVGKLLSNVDDLVVTV